MRNSYNILIRKAEGKRLHGRPRRKWEGNIRMDLRETASPASPEFASQ
jgi:hypothetical protein